MTAKLTTPKRSIKLEMDENVALVLAIAIPSVIAGIVKTVKAFRQQPVFNQYISSTEISDLKRP